MITAYFDDSGTHEQSDIVLVAGIFATEGRLRGLEAKWREELQNPLEGRKPHLKRFHATDCHRGAGEFEDWTSVEREWLVGRLHNFLISSGVSAYGCAVQRRDWDELVVGDYRGVLGDAEGFCIRNCFVVATRWVLGNTFDSQIGFVFDNRPAKVQRDAQAVFAAFRAEVVKPEVASIDFGVSEQTLLLQAADLFAWEMYSHACNFYRTGDARVRRDQALRLFKQLPFQTQLATRESIHKIVDHWRDHVPPDALRAMSEHFTDFDPPR